VKPGVAIRSAHVGMAASNTYVFLTEVLPRAIKKYGGVDPDALRKAALEVDLPEGGTMLGFGVKFYGEGTQMAGQNERSFPVVIQYVGRQVRIVVWPKSRRNARPCCRCRRARPTATNRWSWIDGRDRRAGSRGLGQAVWRLHGRQQGIVQGPIRARSSA